MEVKVGIQHVQREIAIDTDESAVELERRLVEALSGSQLLRLSDTKGRSVLIPTSKIAYVDLGVEHVRPVGFGAV